MITAQTKQKLGVGIYSPAEAALYARVSTQMVNRWLFGDSTGEPVFEPQLDSDQRYVTFLDFVQIMAIRAIRTQRNISLNKIRQLVELAKNEYGIDHPFAYSHMTYSFGSELILSVKQRDQRVLVQASGKEINNLMMKPIVEIYLEDLSFDALGLANKFVAYNWSGCTIEMNPQIHFGEPMVTSAGYSAAALYDAFISEGSIADAAKAFGVRKEEIAVACRYIDHLQGRIAA